MEERVTVISHVECQTVFGTEDMAGLVAQVPLHSDQSGVVIVDFNELCDSDCLDC